jgi:hypothetical protein
MASDALRLLKRSGLSAGLLLAVLASPGWGDTYPKNPDIDILHYTFRLTLSDATDEIVGETTVDLRFLRRGVSEFALDLVKAAPEKEGRGMTVSGVTSDLGAIRIRTRPRPHPDPPAGSLGGGSKMPIHDRLPRPSGGRAPDRSQQVRRTLLFQRQLAKQGPSPAPHAGPSLGQGDLRNDRHRPG